MRHFLISYTCEKGTGRAFATIEGQVTEDVILAWEVKTADDLGVIKVGITNFVELEPSQVVKAEALPYWPPCNEACDPEFHGSRNRHCACDRAKKAMSSILGREVVSQSQVRAGHSEMSDADYPKDRVTELEVKALVEDSTLQPVHGDVLPPIGSTVLIHLARSDSWVPHTVVGYYAWPDLGGNTGLHRLFIRVKDADGYLNARLLEDVITLEQKSENKS